MILLTFFKNVQRQRLGFLVLMLCLLVPTTLCAQKYKKQKEPDGYIWYCGYNMNTHVYDAKNRDGKIIIPSSRGYSYIEYRNGMFQVSKDHKCGVCDLSGKEIIPPDWGFDYASKSISDIICVKRNGIWGAFDLSGKEIISLDRGYHWVLGLENYISVKRDDHEGACDLSGNEVVAPIYNSIDFVDGVFKYKDVHGQWHPVPPTSSSSSTSASDNSNSEPAENSDKHKSLRTEDDGFQWYSLLNFNGYKGAQDINGKDLIPLSAGWKRLWYYHGYFMVADPSIDGRYNNCGVFTKEGKEIIGGNRYDEASIMDWNDDNKWFLVKKKGKEGACDIWGKEIITPRYDALSYNTDEGFTYDHYGSRVATFIFLPGSDSKTAPKHYAQLQKVWLEQDCDVNGKEGMKVHCDLTVQGMRNQIGHMEVWIKNSKGKWHKFYSNGTSPDGVSYHFVEFVPGYDETVYSDLCCNMYNSDMEFNSGTNTYEAIVRITDKNGVVLAENAPISFTKTVSRPVSHVAYTPVPYNPYQYNSTKKNTSSSNIRGYNNNTPQRNTTTSSTNNSSTRKKRDICTECKGSGKATCHLCKGTGRDECGTCYGTGMKYVFNKPGVKKEMCNYCNGVGSKECKKCSGSGKIRCIRCSGSGYW